MTSIYGGRRYVSTQLGMIMRAFVQLRQMAGDHQDLLRKVNEMERKYDDQLKVVFSAIKRLMEPPSTPKKKIGFLGARTRLWSHAPADDRRCVGTAAGESCHRRELVPAAAPMDVGLARWRCCSSFVAAATPGSSSSRAGCGW